VSANTFNFNDTIDLPHPTLLPPQFSPRSKALVMNNYFSIGVDAEVALKFHRLREEKPKYFKSRLINKGWYGLYGMEGMIKNCGPLWREVLLTVDGREVAYSHDIAGIIVLNIGSYGGGTDPWGHSSSKSKWKKSAMNDGLLEVVGVTG
jgi:diacylglycerol kinase (ATP)